MSSWDVNYKTQIDFKPKRKTLEILIIQGLGRFPFCLKNMWNSIELHIKFKLDKQKCKQGEQKIKMNRGEVDCNFFIAIFHFFKYV